MAQQSKLREIRGIVENALQSKYKEAGKLDIVSYVRDEEKRVWLLDTLWSKPGRNCACSLLLEIDEAGETKELTPEPAGRAATPEQLLMDLLEEGICMGRFDAVRAKKEVWDNLTSK